MTSFTNRLLTLQAVIVLVLACCCGFAYANDASSGSSARTVKASGWYWIDLEDCHFCKNGTAVCDYTKRIKDGTPFRNGLLTSSAEHKLVSGNFLKNRKFKIAKKVKYARFSISGEMVRHLSKSKTLSRKDFIKAAKKKTVRLLFAKVQKGKVVKAYWMSELSAEMLD